MPRKNYSQKKEKIGKKQNSDVYSRQKEWLDKKNEKINKLKKTIEDKQMEGVTFEPTINKNSRKIVKKNKNRKGLLPDENWDKQIAEQENKYHEEHPKPKVERKPFKPHVNSRYQDWERKQLQQKNKKQHIGEAKDLLKPEIDKKNNNMQKTLEDKENILKKKLQKAKQEKNKEIEEQKKAYEEKIKKHHLKEMGDEIEKLEKLIQKLDPETKDKNIEQNMTKNKKKLNSSSIKNKADKITTTSAKQDEIKVADKKILKDIEDKIKTLTKEKEKIEEEQKEINELYNKQIQKISKKVNIKIQNKISKSRGK